MGILGVISIKWVKSAKKFRLTGDGKRAMLHTPIDSYFRLQLTAAWRRNVTVKGKEIAVV